MAIDKFEERLPRPEQVLQIPRVLSYMEPWILTPSLCESLIKSKMYAQLLDVTPPIL